MAQRILLVEDDVTLRDIYKTRLEAEGFTIDVEGDGESALARALELAPSLILLDLMMPTIDGFSVLDILKKTSATKHIPIIILTALSDDSDRSRARALGADDYVVKSEQTLSDVVARIKRLLGAG